MLYDRCAYLWAAYELHQGQDREVAAVEQARILARESDEEIADKCGMTPLTIERYEKLFFNVRDVLNATDWLYVKALKAPPAVSRGEGGEWTEAERHWAYRSFAY